MHKFEEKKIRASCVRDYPRVTEDIMAPQEIKGVLNLICDHLLDLELLKRSESDGEQNNADETNLQTSDIESTQFKPDIPLETIPARVSLDNSQQSLLQQLRQQGDIAM